MTGELKVIVVSILASVLIIVGAVAVLGQDKSPQREKLGTASMTIDKNLVDLGDMKKDDEKNAVFTITNTSSSILRIWKVATSCDCTFATLTMNGQTTPEFNMAGMMRAELTNWIGELPAGQKAKLTVIYRPKIMPVSGKITRQINFETNDPKNSNVQVSIAANVL